MQYHSNDSVTPVRTSDDDSCFTPIDKELEEGYSILCNSRMVNSTMQ